MHEMPYLQPLGYSITHSLFLNQALTMINFAATAAYGATAATYAPYLAISTSKLERPDGPLSGVGPYRGAPTM